LNVLNFPNKFLSDFTYNWRKLDASSNKEQNIVINELYIEENEK
jgi:hypothetical protein